MNTPNISNTSLKKLTYEDTPSWIVIVLCESFHFSEYKLYLPKAVGNIQMLAKWTCTYGKLS